MNIEQIKITDNYAVINWMTPVILKKLKILAEEGNIKQLYWTKIWKRLRKVILAYDHNECQVCKSRGKHTTATMIHHIKHLEYYLELGLSSTYIDGQGNEYRQLISLCDNCHTEIHLKPVAESKLFISEERW